MALVKVPEKQGPIAKKQHGRLARGMGGTPMLLNGCVTKDTGETPVLRGS